MKRVCIFCLVFLFSFPHFLKAADYYWVGALNNDWYTPQNWLVSGVTPGSAPGNSDNVFFNAASFPTPGLSVNISNASTARCRSISWVGATNNPTFSGSGPLIVTGNMTLISGMTWTYTGDVTFEIGLIAMPARTITTAGVQINSRMIFSASGVTWSLSDALNSNRDVVVNEGGFVTNNWNIIAPSFNSSTTNTRTIDFGSSTLTLSSAGAGVYSVNSTNLTFNGASSTINITSTTIPIVSAGAGLAYNNINFTATAYATGSLGGSNCTFNNVTIANASGNISISTSNCTFNTLTVGRNANFSGNNNTFQNLILSSGKRYTFQSTQTQIIHNLTANGTCASGNTEIYSSIPGSAANVVKQSGALTLSKIVLRGISISGPTGPFTINDVVDLGGNSGWVLNPYSPPPALYWVKVAGSGTGNWSDANHWSTSSGGAGGACVPTSLDNVVFDANSFGGPGETVTIDNYAHCNDMTWTGVNSPSFSGSGSFDLNIYGNLVFHSSMNTAGLGVVTYFRATAVGKTITSAGKTFPNSVWFVGTGGWTFLDAFSCSGNIYFENGSLNTNGQNVTTSSFESMPATTRTLTIATSTITVNGSWNVNGTNFTLNALNSLIKMINSGFSTSPGKIYHDLEFLHLINSQSLVNTGGSFNNVTFFGHGNISSNQTFNTLTFSPGKNYILQSGQTQTVNTALNITGTCSGYISIASNSSVAAIISKPSGGVVGDYCIIKDITAVGPVFTANNSIPLGTNVNWNILSGAARNLYWVPVAGSGTGNWSDQNHWSLSSGGPGGACLPTLNDNVFFDGNSFTSSPAAQTVTIDQDAICHNMDWSGSLYTPRFSGNWPNKLKIYGSLTFISAMTINYNCETYFEATTPGNDIWMATRSFPRDVIFEGNGGGWIFRDAFSVNNSYDIIHEWGDINTNNQSVNANSFETNSGNTRSLTFGSSIITLRYRWTSSAAGLTLNSGTSKFIMDGSYSSPTFNHSGTNLNFYDVDFTNGTATLARISTSTATFHDVFFLNNGQITGTNTFNKLTFSPGKTYTLGSNQTQTVDTLVTRGNPCYIITLRSNTSGTQARISKASGSILGDYLNMKDIMGTGGASFFAGQYSTDAGNNTGWTFSNAPGYIFGLGNDTAFQSCGTPITLTTVNFNGVAATTYTWSNGTSGSSLNVSNPGLYWVTANYGSGCIYIDSIRITVNPALLNLQVSPDNSICQGGSSLLTASGGTSYTWGPSTGLSSTTGSSVTATPNVTTSYTVTAVNGICNDNRIITITVTPAPALNATPAATVCQGVSATLTVSGGASYSWSPAVGLSATTGSSVSANPTINTNYIVESNTGGCVSSATVIVTVGSTPVINVVSQTDVTCNGLNNGTVNLNASGAGGGYTFVWSTLQTGNVITNLSAGTFTATVTDANGCTEVSVITITEPPSLSLSVISQSDVLCNGTQTGVATVNGVGGTSPFNYNWTGGHTGAAVTNLQASVYTVSVTDNHNCVATNTVSISEPPAITMTMDSVDATCGLPNGSVSVLVSGGSGGFTYVWNTGGATTTSVSSLGTGIYSVTVTDGNSCTKVNSILVNSIGSPTLAILSHNDATCNGATDGGVAIIAGGGTGTYNYLWSNTSTASVLTGLSQGVYTATVSDGNGCIATTTVNITEPTPLVINIASQNDVLCNGQITGSVTANASGGNNGFVYSWSNTIATAANNNIAAGIYTLTVTDANNCTAVTNVTITEPTLLTAVITGHTDVLCNGMTTGSATALGNGGTGVLNYTWSNAINTAINNNISASVYTVTVTDANGCVATETVTITEPPALVVNVSASANICAGDNVSLSASSVGGTGTVSFDWNPGLYSGSPYNVSPTATTTYTMIATDDNGCTAGPYNVTLTVPTSLLVNISNPTTICIGENVTLTSSASGGAGGYNYNWLPAAVNTSSLVVSPNTPTTYSMVVTDNCNVTTMATVLVNVNSLPVVTFNSDVTAGCAELCVNFNNTTAATSSVQWSFGDANGSANVSPQHCYTSDGSYNVKLIVTDVNGCVDSLTTPNMITVHPRPTAQFVASAYETTIVTPEISFVDQSNGAVSWAWSFGDASNGTSNLQNASYTYSEVGNYKVKQVVVNQFGCADSSEQYVNVKADYVFYVPNTFTPNNDGLNDEFIPYSIGLDVSRDYQMSIYDRWGNLIFKTTDPNKGWNARKNNSGDEVIQDTYIWMISTRDILGKSHAYDGRVNVIR